MTLTDLAEVLEAAARRARELAAEARASHQDWIDQSTTPLGRRRHVARVRARVAAGQPGAAMVGRRALLSADALAEELASPTTTKRPRKVEAPTTGLPALRKLLGGRS